MAGNVYQPEIIGSHSGPIAPDMLLMRHGRTTSNRRKTFQTGQDPMDETGRRQVRQAAANLCGLIAAGIVVLDRPLVAHHGPLPRQQETCEIALAELAAHGVHPAYVESRQELVERISVAGSDLNAYDPQAAATRERGHTWFHVLYQLDPYLRALQDRAHEQQVIQFSSGGTLGVEKILMLHGLEGALHMLERDSRHGPEDDNPDSSQWYINKVPNASIDICRYTPDGWQWEMRVLPTEPVRT